MSSDCMFDYTKLPYGKTGGFKNHNRLSWRAELMLVRNREMIENKVVIDLACNTGRLSYPCLALGAKKVIGLDARAEPIENGRKKLEGTGFEDRMEFVQADLFEYLGAQEPGTFDTILCFGFLYHTVRQVEFFRLLRRLAPECTIIDTSTSNNYVWYGLKNFLKRSPALFIGYENADLNSDTTDDDGVILWPSRTFIEEMLTLAGYDWKRIPYTSKDIKNWGGLRDYKKGQRVSYIGRRKK